MEDNNTETIPIALSFVESKAIPVVCPWCDRISEVVEREVEYGRKTSLANGICSECIRYVYGDKNLQKHK